MAIVELFSKRQKSLRGDVPDVYSYDELPPTLRTQIIHIMGDALGGAREYYGGTPRVAEAYKFIVDTLCREYGVFHLPGTPNNIGGNRDNFKDLTAFLLHEIDTERTLDAIELSFLSINVATINWDYLHRANSKEIANAAINELNARFKEHAIGYQYADRRIIRIDSELIHAEVVKPALRLLNQKNYAGAQQEFLKAHEHYRKGNAKEALNECLKSFESLMKAICEKRKWICKQPPTASNLIDTCLQNKLIPEFWQQNFTSLRSLLTSSIPSGRNKLSGHGQGTTTTEVPNHLVAYMIHMTASTLVFLAEADASVP